MGNPIAIAIHGGAGTIQRSTMTAALQAEYEAGLASALQAGYACLEHGGSALDAVTEAVTVLEDFPLFNAGRGSVFNHVGQHEMDAAIMEGNKLSAGAVTGVNGIKNPVQLARLVMEQTPHVLLSGSGAMEFARQQGIALLPDDYFYVAQRYQQWQEALQEGAVRLDHSERKFGTVGAVALDASGDLAAATSTGGMTNKQWGRVGDTPIIGAGTYARNNTCAVSCTGHGEVFMKAVVAHEIASLMAYGGLGVAEAAEKVVMDTLVKMGGEGGVIALDAQGNIVMPFNSEGMYRACRNSLGRHEISIYRD
ncbi:MAG: isoaspartyl peptidase/L-asparaginase [Chitinophagia bacterium]|nr:isoaspartyl peptidase/L-asparaginase [Chitinophagia bacterium]